MQARERVIMAASQDLAWRLYGTGARLGNTVAESTPEQASSRDARPADLELLQSLAQGVVEAVLGLAGRPLDLAQTQELVRREAQKHLMSRPELARPLAARLIAEAPRLIDLERVLALAQAGLEALPAMAADHGPETPVGGSDAFRRVLDDLERVAATDFPVLLTGESGTGKELLARRLHRFSPRRQGPLVAVNCAAISEGVLESELFGHEKGAFTGAASSRLGHIRRAQGGTLFLDEIGLASDAVQMRLLRALEQRAVTPVGGGREVPVDVRLVAASHQDLAEAAGRGEFSQALLYRIQVVPLRLPPLRERPQDVPELLDHFLARACGLAGRECLLSSRARDMLMRYNWPGNVRQLMHMMQRLVVLCPGPEIRARDLPPEVARPKGQAAQWERALSGVQGIPETRVPQLARLLAAGRGGQMSNKDLRGPLGCSDTTAKNLFKALERAGLVRMTGQRGGRRYLVTAPEED